jgi:hypothetical protein
MMTCTHSDNATHRANATASGNRHEEWLLDEAIRDSFPASDPTSPSQPGSIVNERYARDLRRDSGSKPFSIPQALTAMTLATALTALTALTAAAQDGMQERQAYEQRAKARYVELFASLDRDKDDDVSRSEADGNVEFTAAFDDIDINRDGVVTRAELDRFLQQKWKGNAS